MIKALIIDDEQSCIDVLYAMLKENFRNIDVQTMCRTVDEGKAAIIEYKPDLVFLDVEISDKTGFDLLQEVDSINFEVIFTTAHVKYALQAIKFSALDYLLKPCTLSDLTLAIERFKQKQHKATSGNQFEALFHNIKNMQTESRKIALPSTNGLELVYIQDIVRLDSDGNYTTFHLKNKMKIVVSKTIKEYEEMLEELNFFRVHNSHIVNLRYVKNYIKGEGGIVKMEDGSEIDVSRRKKEDFLTALRKV